MPELQRQMGPAPGQNPVDYAKSLPHPGQVGPYWTRDPLGGRFADTIYKSDALSGPAPKKGYSFIGMDSPLWRPHMERKGWNIRGMVKTSALDGAGGGQNENFGPESFGTYAPDINPNSFKEPKWRRKALKGMKDLNSGGLMSGRWGSVGSGMDLNSMGFGMDPMMQQFMSQIFPQMMKDMDNNGPRVGR